MKIALLLDDRLDVADGVQQYVRTLGSWLEKQGHTVHYLVGEATESGVGNVFGLSKTVGLRFNQNRVRIPLPVSKRKVRKFLTEQKYDVLHVQMPYAPWMSGRVITSAPSTTAIVGTFHVVVASGIISRLSHIVRYITRQSTKRIMQAIAVSPPAQDYMRSYLGMEGIIIPNAVNTVVFRSGRVLEEFADGKTNVLFLGRLVERKGAELLLTAFSKMTQPARLIIAGDGPLREKLERRARKIHNDVVFVGYIDEADKSSYLKTADIAIFPSSGGESFGIVLIEAMSAGAGVVLAGDNPGYRSVMKDIPEALISVSDPDELSRQISNYVTDKKRRRELNKKQTELVKSFDIDVVGKKLLAVYDDALNRTRKVT